MNPLIEYSDILSKSFQLYVTNTIIMSKYNSAYAMAFQQALKAKYKDNENKRYNKYGTCYTPKYEDVYQNWLKNSDIQLDTSLKSSEFISLLSDNITLNTDIHRALRNMGHATHYLDMLFENSIRRMYLASSTQKDFQLTPFDVEYVNGNIRLLHYHNGYANEKDATPLLIIYAQINRFHILDIHPSRSVVKSLVSKGLDVYLLDWGYPSSKDNNMSLSDYVQYVKEAVQHIHQKDNVSKKKDGNNNNNGNTAGFDPTHGDDNTVIDYSGSGKKNKGIVAMDMEDDDEGENGISKNKKISIMGYCWGGIVALAFASIYNKHIKNLTLMAVPIDFSKDSTMLSTWAKAIDTDKLVEEFAHIDGQILDLGFIMRNPFRYTFDKYVTMAKRYDDKEFIDMFVSVEKWLYDTPIVPEKLFKQIINECYKNNLLIKNRLKVNGERVNLPDVHVPLLTIVAEKDDLVSPTSTLEVNNYVSSKEKKTVRSPGGHVALCISREAHKIMWPEVAEWIKSN
jgi:polyhydroxyalkanoate synthase